MDAGQTVAGRADRRALWRIADDVQKILEPPIRFRDGSLLFGVSLQAHTDIMREQVNLYAAINGESTATVGIPTGPFLLGSREEAAAILRRAMSEVESLLDQHQNQIIERAFSQASSPFMFRG